MLKKCIITTASVAALSLTGCSTMQSAYESVSETVSGVLEVPSVITNVFTPYRPDVYQGNLITKEQIDQVQLGMTQMQVQFLLGVPLLRDMFHQNRWDYIYYVNPRSDDPQHRYLTIHFDEEGRVSKFTHSDMPTETQADRMILGDETDFDTKNQALTTVDREAQSQTDVERNAAL